MKNVDASMLSKRFSAIAQSPRLLWGLCLVLVVVCLTAAVNVALLLGIEPENPQIIFPRAAGDGQQNRITLFRDTSVTQSDRQNLDEASVNAELLGVISSGSQAFASLKINGKKEAIFKVNDTIANGVTVQAIEPLRVIVRERGQLKSITLKSLLDNRNGGQLELTAQKIDNPPTARQLPVVFTPTMTDTGESGMRIEKIDQSLAELGLFQRGDTVVALEGQSLSEVLANPDLQASLAAQQEVSVTVLRQGVEVMLNVDPVSLNALMAP